MRNARAKGLSIVEVVVGVVILVGVLAGVFSFSSFGRRSVERDAILTESMDRKMHIVEIIRHELSTAIRILSPLPGAESGCIAYVDGFGALKVLLLSEDRRNLCLRVLGDANRYVLTRAEGSPVVLQELTFGNDGPKGVGLRLVFDDGTRGTTVTQKVAPLVARCRTHAVD